MPVVRAMTPRYAAKIATAGLLVTLGFATSCTLVLQRSGDEIRRQQNGSEPFATGEDSREGKEPWRAIVHSAGYDAGDGLVDGALAAAQDPEREQQLEQLGDDLEARAGSTAKAAGEGLVAGVSAKIPEAQPFVMALLEGVRDELNLDPERMGRQLARGAMSEARVGVRNLRPEVHRLLEEDIVGVFREAFDGAFGPGLKQRARDDIKPAIDELGIPVLAEDVGKRTALGFSAGMAEALGRDGRLGLVIDERVARAKETAGDAKDAVDAWLARGLLLALVIAVVVIVLVVFRWLRERGERVEAQRARNAAAEEGERRERMLRLVTGAIKQAGARDGLVAFREEIKRLSQQEGDRETAAALSYFLTREGLKLEKPAG
jgi:hypothetical protein